jgi:hypothetical protein
MEREEWCAGAGRRDMLTLLFSLQFLCSEVYMYCETAENFAVPALSCLSTCANFFSNCLFEMTSVGSSYETQCENSVVEVGQVSQDQKITRPSGYEGEQYYPQQSATFRGLPSGEPLEVPCFLLPGTKKCNGSVRYPMPPVCV